MMKLTIDLKEVDGLMRRLSRVDKKKIHEGMGFIIEKDVAGLVSELGLVDSGLYRNSINHDIVDNDKVLITDGVKYGKYLEYGTRAHMIKPKNKKALHWSTDGGGAFSKGHMVSGIQEYAPFRKGALRSIPEVTRYVTKKLMEAKK